MKTYVIQQMIFNGFFATDQTFKGYIYARHYSSFQEAEDNANEIEEPVKIIKVYD